MSRKKDLYLSKTHTLEELNKNIDKGLKKTKQHKEASLLLTSANEILPKAEEAYANGDEELSYVIYMTYLELVKAIQKTPEYEQDKVYFNKMIGPLKPEDVLCKCELLFSSLKSRYKMIEEAARLEKVEPEKEVSESEASENENQHLAQKNLQPTNPTLSSGTNGVEQPNTDVESKVFTGDITETEVANEENCQQIIRNPNSTMSSSADANVLQTPFSQYASPVSTIKIKDENSELEWEMTGNVGNDEEKEKKKKRRKKNIKKVKKTKIDNSDSESSSTCHIDKEIQVGGDEIESQSQNTSQPNSEENSESVATPTLPVALENEPLVDAEQVAMTHPLLDTNWRNSLKTMQSKLKFIITNENPFFDVTFCVGAAKQAISAHKFVLILSSNVFEKMILENKKDDKIPVPNVEPDAFNQLLYYIYTDEFDTQAMKNTELALSVMKAAVQFQIPQLSKCISKLIKSTLSVTNCIHIFEEAQDNLLGDSQQFIMTNAKKVFAREEYLSLSHSKLCKLLTNNNLLLDEMTVFEKTLSWAKEECKKKEIPETAANIRLVLDKALYLIRFPLLSPQDFTINVLRHEILSESEQLEIFKYFSVRDVPNSKSIISELRFNCKQRATKNPTNITSSQISIPSLLDAADKISYKSQPTQPVQPLSPSPVKIRPLSPSSAKIQPLMIQSCAIQQSSSFTASNVLAGPSMKEATNSAISIPVTTLEKDTLKNIKKATEELFDNLSEETFHQSLNSFIKIPICNNQGRAECFVRVFFRKLSERAPMCYLFAKFIDVAIRNTNQTQRLKAEIMDFSGRIYDKRSFYDQVVLQAEQKVNNGTADLEKYEEKKSKLRFQYLCNVKLMAEFFKLKILALSVIMAAVTSFVDACSDESMENLYHLLINCGKELDAHLIQMTLSELPLKFKHNWMDTIFQQLGNFFENKQLRFEIRLMLLELIELRQSGWTKARMQPS